MRADKPYSALQGTIAALVATGTEERFEIVERLGAGAMGIVFHARDREHGGQDVALKVLKQFDAAALFRFKREFRTLADVVHPNLVSLYELVCVQERWMFTMELVRGVDFARFVRGTHYDTVPTPVLAASGYDVTAATVEAVVAAGVQVPEAAPASGEEIERLRRVLPQLADGVQAIHRRGKLHRDLKPSNVLVDALGRVVVMDFGIATGLAGAVDATMTRGVVGTPRYMAPEQAAANELTTACDWYAVGVMLYEVIAGRRPFEGDTNAVMAMKLATSAPPIQQLVPDLAPDLRDLCNGLLARDPSERFDGDAIRARLEGISRRGPAVRPAAGDVAETPLVGRDRELGVLRDALAEVDAGTGAVVHVRGHSGLGKTALVDEFLRSLAGRTDVVVLRGRCYEQESVPYKALDSLVDALTTHLASMTDDEALALVPPDMAALVRLFPVLRRVEALVASELGNVAPADPLTLRRRAMLTLRELVDRLCARARLVLYIDDLQWGDTESAGVLADVFREGDLPHGLLVLAYRPEEDVSPFLQTFLARQGEPLRVSVGRLSLPNARELATTLLSAGDASWAGLAETVARESHGSPFFVHELTRYVRAREAAGEHVDDSLNVTLEEVLFARMDALPRAARQLLDVVAVAAHPIAQAVALAAAGASARDAPVIAQLRHEHLVRTSGIGAAGLIETAHDRIRETIVQQLSPHQRREYHSQIADALEARGGADPEAIASHLDAAGRTERVAEYLIAAANNAADALAFDRAVALFSRALERTPADASGRQALTVRLAEALGFAGRSRPAADAYLAAAELAGDCDGHELRKLAAEHLLYSGEIDRGVAVLEGVLVDVGVRMPRTSRGVLASLVWVRARLTLRGTGFRVKRITATDEQRKFMEACWSAGIGFSMVDTMRSVEFNSRHLLAALASGDSSHISRGLTAEACLVSLSGGRGLRRAHKVCARAIAIAEELADPSPLVWARASTGFVAYMSGDWERARETVRRSIELFTTHRTGYAWELSTVRQYEIWALFYLGELAEMRHKVEEFLRDARERGDLYAATNLTTGLAAVGPLTRGDPARVRRTVAEAMAAWSPNSIHLQHYWATIAVVMADLYEGRAERAVRRIEEDWPTFRAAMFLRVQMVRLEFTMLRGIAHVARAQQQLDAGESHARATRSAARDARALRRSELAAFRHVGRAIDGAVAALRGNVALGRATLEQAIAGFDEHSMSMHAACARHRLGDPSAQQWMTRNQIADPDRFARMISPGPFDDA